MNLHERIRDARKAAGYTSQMAFADALPVAKRTVERWETGANQPSVSQLRRIADRTGYPIEFFLDAIPDEEDEMVAQAEALTRMLLGLVRQAAREVHAEGATA